MLRFDIHKLDVVRVELHHKFQKLGWMWKERVGKVVKDGNDASVCDYPGHVYAEYRHNLLQSQVAKQVTWRGWKKILCRQSTIIYGWTVQSNGKNKVMHVQHLFHLWITGLD
jgi:hypothetical protein